MGAWTEAQLKTIIENEDLFVAPFREDGVTYGTPTQTWAIVIGDEVFVRAANGQASRWYQAAMTQKAGRIRVAGTFYDVTFESAGDEVADAMDAGYEEKYSDSASIAVMQGTGPKSATVRIVPR